MDPMEDPLEIMKRGLLSGFGDDLDKDRAERDDYQSEAGQEIKVSLNMGVVLPEMGGDELRELYDRYNGLVRLVNSANIQDTLSQMGTDIGRLIHEVVRARSENEAWRDLAGSVMENNTLMLRSVQRGLKYSYDADNRVYLNPQTGRQIDFPDNEPDARTVPDDDTPKTFNMGGKLMIGPVEDGEKARALLEFIRQAAPDGQLPNESTINAILARAHDLDIPVSLMTDSGPVQVEAQPSDAEETDYTDWSG